MTGVFNMERKRIPIEDLLVKKEMTIEDKIELIDITPLDEEGKEEVKKYELSEKYIYQKKYGKIIMFYSKEYLEKTSLDELIVKDFYYKKFWSEKNDK